MTNTLSNRNRNLGELMTDLRVRLGLPSRAAHPAPTSA